MKNLGIFQSLKLRSLIEKVFPISLKLNFTQNTLGSYGLTGKDNLMTNPIFRFLSSRAIQYIHTCWVTSDGYRVNTLPPSDAVRNQKK